MTQTKQHNRQPAEEIFDETSKGADFSSSDLGKLTAEIVALRKAHEAALNEIELKAVYGMISYVAHDQSVGEDIVGEIVTSHFGVSAVAALPSRLYQNAIEYLMDLKMDKIVN
ncbi:MAG: hypothetical protein PHD48_09620 [Alphaproteobacteria bacterium]|nr:hypothetical protein [Alphaproteobacteria bacterium]